MRIVSGFLKGRQIKLSKGAPLRPTSERVREAIFSVLTARGVVDGCLAVDLFAGSGALGIEALSRGAERGLFVEKDAKLAAGLKQRIAEFELSDRATMLQLDVYKSLNKLAAELEKFELPRLLLIDPPYTEHPGEELPKLLVESGIFKPGTTMVYGAPTTLDLEFKTLESLSLDWQMGKTYGQTRINFFHY